MTAIDDLISTLLNGLKGIFQLHLTEKKGDAAIIGSYYIVFSPENIEYHKGIHSSPDIAITTNETDFLLLSQGKLSPVSAFMSGTIKMKGNMQLAMKAFSVSEAARRLAKSHVSKL